MKRKRAIKQIYTTHKRLCNNLHYVHSKDCKSNNWNPRDQENQVRVVKPVAQRGDPYALYVGIVWRYQRGVQNPSIEKRTEN